MTAIWTRINTAILLLVLLALLTLIAMFATGVRGGPLDPPGAPGETDGVREPGTPIQTIPFAITSPGYYYLTHNLSDFGGSFGIRIDVSDVTLDLKGFTLQGGGGSLDGVSVPAARANIAIRNGVIRDWGGSGIVFAAPNFSVGSNMHDLHVTNNDGYGIWTGKKAIIHDVTSHGNGLGGIAASFESVIQRCMVGGNGGYGISAPDNALVVDCSVWANGGDGINVGTGSVVRGNTVRGNSGDGVEVSTGSLVEGNVLTENGQQVTDGAGVHATGPRNRIVDNLANTNDRGIAVDVGGSLIIGNHAVSNNVTNYAGIVAGNFMGPVLTSLTIDDAGANPHANFGP